MFRGSGTRTWGGFRKNQGMHWHFQDGNRLLMAGRRHLQQQDFFVPGKNGESKVQMDGADMGKPVPFQPTFWGESNP